MLKKFKNYLKKLGLDFYSPKEDKNIILFELKDMDKNATKELKCLLSVEENDKRVIFYSLLSFNVPKERMLTFAEFIIRLNSIIFFGNFEMDFEDGQIRFKTSLIYEDCKLTNDVMKHIIDGNITITNIHFNTFEELMKEKISLKDAITKIENL